MINGRADLLQVIKDGGSVLLNGKHYSKSNIAEFPTEADMAAGNAEEEARVKALLKSEAERIQAELAKLDVKAEIKVEEKTPEVKPETNVVPEVKTTKK
jgi:chromosome condensin MukBEF MukE localization factor